MKLERDSGPRRVAVVLCLAALGGPGCEPLGCGPGTTRAEAMCVATGAPGGPRRFDGGAPAGLSGGRDTGDTAAAGLVEVYLLVGQSNMDGYAPVTGLPPSLLVAQPDVALYWSPRGSFAPLAPSSRLGAAWTGPEVSFGRALADAGREVALVKEATGGVSLATWWYPGEAAGDPDAGAGWAALTTTLARAAGDLDAAGRPWRWAGVAMLQGEADAWNADHAAAFEENLARFVRRVREETGTPDLPFAVGELHCAAQCPWNDVVVAAQEAVAASDPDVTVVETGDLSGQPGDDKHLDGPSVRVLGRRLAQAFLGEALAPAPVSALTVSSWSAGGGGGATVGWRFTTSAPLTFTDVGGFGEAAPASSREWGLWDAGTAALLARGHVPGADEAPTSGRDGFWYVAVEPIVLPPGDYVLGLATGDEEPSAEAGTATLAPGLSFVEGRAADGAWLAYPASAGEVGYLGPGFLYVE